MSVASQTAPSGVSRRKVYTIMILIILLGLIGFIMSYLLNTNPASVLAPLTGPVGDQTPQPQFMIYGTFGEGQFNKPMDVAVINERVFVSDTNKQRIQVFDYDGKFLKRFGEKGNGEGQFQFPYGIAGDSQGNVYVADLYLGRISVFDQEGNFLKYFTEEAVLDGPGDIVIKDDKLYVTDINKSKILVFNLAGEKLLEFGEPGRATGQMLAPNGIAVDDDGNMYVVDTGNSRVGVYGPEGNLINLFNGAPQGQQSVFVNPRGISIRGDTLFVVSNLTHVIYSFDLNGEMKEKFGSLGNMNDQFMLPNGLFIDENSRIYISDAGNHRVAVYR